MPARLFVWVTQLVNCYKLQISLGINSTKVLDPARFKKVTRPTDSPPPLPRPSLCSCLEEKTDLFTSLLSKVSIPDCYLIHRYWRDSISQGFIFTISLGKYEKGLESTSSSGRFSLALEVGLKRALGTRLPLNFAIQPSSSSFHFSRSLNLLKSL